MILSSSDIKKRWREIKMEKQFDKSEDWFGMDREPDFQCPNIDKIIKTIRSIESDSDYGKYDEFEDLKHRLESINSDTYNLDSEVEDVRTAIEQVRDWGKQWKHLTIELIVKYDIDIEKI